MRTRYKARVATPDGVHQITLAATGLEDARATAEQQGVVLECAPVQQGLIPPQPLSSDEREQLFTQMAFQLASGVGVSEALRMLQKDHHSKVGEIAAELLYHVEIGAGLDGAIREVGAPHFPLSTVAIVEAGYRSGAGIDSLETAANFEAELREIHSTSGSGLVSAFFGFIAAALTTSVSVFYFGPTVLESDLIKAGGEAVSVAWAVILGNVIGVAMLLGLLIVLGLLSSRYLLRPVAPVLADRISGAIPVWRDIALARDRYLAYHGLSELIRAGVGLEHAFSTVAAGMRQGLLRVEVQRAAHSVREGQSWANSLTSLGHSDLAALRQAGDRSQISATFKRMALLYRKAYGSALRKSALTLSILAAFSLTLSGVVIFALTILPMLQTASAIL